MHHRYSLLLLLVAACGDRPAAGPPPGSLVQAQACADELAAFEPCGGDPTGTWKGVSLCMDPGAAAVILRSLPGCQGATMEVPPADVSGSVSYAADGAYTSDLLAQVTTGMRLPDACLRAIVALSGGEGSADQLCRELGASMSPDPSVTAGCTHASGACVCSSEQPYPLGGEGTYAVEGSRLVAGDTAAEFCVQGGQLLLRPDQGDAQAPQMLLVLQRT